MAKQRRKAGRGTGYEARMTIQMFINSKVYNRCSLMFTPQISVPQYSSGQDISVDIEAHNLSLEQRVPSAP